jgi:hypothetical protein
MNTLAVQNQSNTDAKSQQPSMCFAKSQQPSMCFCLNGEVTAPQFDFTLKLSDLTKTFRH